MHRTLLAAIPALAAIAIAAPAIAQNNTGSASGLSDWEDAPVAQPSRTVTFTASGAYADQGEQRLIDVKADRDVDGDGTMDQGVLRVTCNGGDLISGLFSPSASLSGKKPVTAAGSSALAAGKTFKGGSAQTSDAGIKVTLGSDQPDVCARG